MSNNSNYVKKANEAIQFGSLAETLFKIIGPDFFNDAEDIEIDGSKFDISVTKTISNTDSYYKMCISILSNIERYIIRISGLYADPSTKYIKELEQEFDISEQLTIDEVISYHNKLADIYNEIKSTILKRMEA